MKYLYLTGALLIFLFLSCHKSNNGNNPSPYFLKLSIDSVARDFSGDAKAVKFTSGSIFNLSITGHPDPANGGENLFLIIQNNPSNKPLVPGAYSQLDSNFELTAGYNPNNTAIEYTVGTFLYPANPLVITITSIDSSSVTGTFSGDFYFQNIGAVVAGPDKKTLQGDFYLPLQFTD